MIPPSDPHNRRLAKAALTKNMGAAQGRPKREAEPAFKGLANDVGLYHCFLNVCIQALYRVEAFRERFFSLEYTHTHAGPAAAESCIFCALRDVFSAYRFGEESVVSQTRLRETLHRLYAHVNRFQLREMDDAEEALDAVLKWLHCEQVGVRAIEDFQDVACSPACISHATFGSQLVDIRVCLVCGRNSDPVPTQSFLYRVYVADLLEGAEEARKAGFRRVPSLDALLGACVRSERHPCPEAEEAGCLGRSTVHRWSLTQPDVLAFSLAWPPEPSGDTIAAVVGLLSEGFDLGRAVKLGGGGSGSGSARYTRAGMICYYGKHYVSMFYSAPRRQWVLLDDSRVRWLGGWDDVARRCRAGKLQPVVLFYEAAGRKPERASADLAKSMLPAARREPVLDMPQMSGAIEEEAEEEADAAEEEVAGEEVAAGEAAAPPPKVAEDAVDEKHDCGEDGGGELWGEPAATAPGDTSQTAARWACVSCRRGWTAGLPSCPMCGGRMVGPDDEPEGEGEHSAAAPAELYFPPVNPAEEWACAPCGRRWPTGALARCPMCDAPRASLLMSARKNAE